MGFLSITFLKIKHFFIEYNMHISTGSYSHTAVGTMAFKYYNGIMCGWFQTDSLIIRLFK